ncbi:hypothetical protein LTR62_003164 [Meristemomyces frigidus]|uniref:FAD-binding domain-containing protein n=1 Tax=Meristemomyces frigidus TaxID=1508187 RepID=A0AAN7TLG8_9PEZI|nr:hypothetical protein LTR62_003164 [Meristemomyces frigidus]
MPPPLHVTIIGAGLAGLATARILRDGNHDITILELLPSNHEVGAALSLGPSAIYLLEPLGFDRKRCRALTAVGSRTYDKEGRQIHYQDMRPFAVANLADWLMMHRVELWEELYRLATAPGHEVGGCGRAARAFCGAEVVGVDVQSGGVRLKSGEVIASDLVVGADGIKSMI